MVDSISQLHSSLYGGSTLYIDGERFGLDLDSIDVFVGDYRCVPISVTDTRITCRIEYAYYVETVTNMGDGGTVKLL